MAEIRKGSVFAQCFRSLDNLQGIIMTEMRTTPHRPSRLSGLVGCLLALLMSSCAVGPKFQRVDVAENSESLLYIYRPWQFGAAGSSPDILINGEEVLTLINGGYSLFRLTPGTYTVGPKEVGIPGSAIQYGRAIRLHLEPWKTYFVKWTPRMTRFSVGPVIGGVVFGDVRFQGEITLQEDEQLAIREISETKYIEPIQTTSKQRGISSSRAGTRNMRFSYQVLSGGSGSLKSGPLR